MASGISIRQALLQAQGQTEDSVDKIVNALNAAGFDCDLEDVQGSGFSDLEAWALVQKPLQLEPLQACAVLEAQRLVQPGPPVNDTRLQQRHAQALECVNSCPERLPAIAGEYALCGDPTIHQALEQDPDLDPQSLRLIERALAAANIDPDGTDESGVFRSLPYRAFQEAPFYLSPHLAAAAFDAALRRLPPLSVSHKKRVLQDFTLTLAGGAGGSFGQHGGSSGASASSEDETVPFIGGVQHSPRLQPRKQGHR